MLKRKLFSCLAYVVFAASLFATACSGRKTQQESVELKKIVIAEPLHSIGYLPLYIGQQEGFFAEEGLDVEVIQATGGSHVTSVMSGDAWGVIGGVDSNAIPKPGVRPDPGHRNDHRPSGPGLRLRHRLCLRRAFPARSA